MVRAGSSIKSGSLHKAIFFDRAIKADAGMWPVGSWVHEPDDERPYYDLDKARRYLEEAGRTGGVEFTAVTHHSPLLVSSAEVVRAMLKKIGIQMDIDVLSSGPATERFNHGQEYPLFITSWSRYPEPDWMASLAYKSDGYYNPGNVLRPEVDELVELWAPRSTTTRPANGSTSRSTGRCSERPGSRRCSTE